jgi:hypothetical protein
MQIAHCRWLIRPTPLALPEQDHTVFSVSGLAALPTPALLLALPGDMPVPAAPEADSRAGTIRSPVRIQAQLAEQCPRAGAGPGGVASASAAGAGLDQRVGACLPVVIPADAAFNNGLVLLLRGGGRRAAQLGQPLQLGGRGARAQAGGVVPAGVGVLGIGAVYGRTGIHTDWESREGLVLDPQHAGGLVQLVLEGGLWLLPGGLVRGAPLVGRAGMGLLVSL